MAKGYVDPEVNGIILDRGLNELLLGDLDPTNPGLDLSPNHGSDGGEGGEWELQNIKVPLPDGATAVADPTGEILRIDE